MHWATFLWLPMLRLAFCKYFAVISTHSIVQRGSGFFGCVSDSGERSVTLAIVEQ